MKARPTTDNAADSSNDPCPSPAAKPPPRLRGGGAPELPDGPSDGQPATGCVARSETETRPAAPRQDETAGGSRELDPERWTERYREGLLRFALARVGDYALAEDLVQDSFLSAWRNRKGFRGDCGERTWLTGILRNKIVDHYRRARSRLSVLAGDLDRSEGGGEDAAGSWLERQPDRRPTARPEAEAERRDFLGDLQEALGGLPPKMRSAFAMRELQGFSTEEITETLRISKENLWVLIHRARHALGERLAERWERFDTFGGLPKT